MILEWKKRGSVKRNNGITGASLRFNLNDQ
jgi:hypothetical protein